MFWINATSLSACATIRDVKKKNQDGWLLRHFHHQPSIISYRQKKIEACVWLRKNTVAFHLPQARGNSHCWALHRKKTTKLMRYIIERNEKLPVTENCRSEQGTQEEVPGKLNKRGRHSVWSPPPPVKPVHGTNPSVEKQPCVSGEPPRRPSVWVSSHQTYLGWRSAAGKFMPPPSLIQNL